MLVSSKVVSQVSCFHWYLLGWQCKLTNASWGPKGLPWIPPYYHTNLLQAFWYYAMMRFHKINLKLHLIAQFMRNCIIHGKSHNFDKINHYSTAKKLSWQSLEAGYSKLHSWSSILKNFEDRGSSQVLRRKGHLRIYRDRSRIYRVELWDFSSGKNKWLFVWL